MVIDLDDYRTTDSRVFSGRERAKKIRKTINLDDIDRTGEQVEVRIPPDTYSVTSSFFLGLFGDSIRNLGEAEFRRRYRFKGEGITPMIEDGIRYATRIVPPL